MALSDEVLLALGIILPGLFAAAICGRYDMLMRVIKKTAGVTWRWFVPDVAMLADWSDDLEAVRRDHLVKKNPIRWVGLVADKSGQQYYVKIERQAGLFGWLKGFFFPKGRSEYSSAQLVASAGVSCAEYVGWGRALGYSGVFSRALVNRVPMRWAWQVMAHDDAQLREKLLQAYLDLATKMAAGRLVHPDFHSQNLLVEHDTMQLTMIDPYGVKKSCWGSLRQSQLSLMPCMFMFTSQYSWEELAQKMVAVKFAATEEQALQLLRDSQRLMRRRGAGSRAKRVRQLLGGTSKFAACTQHGKVRRMVRKNILYQEMAPPTELVCREMSKAEAETIWVASFLGPDPAFRHQPPPVIFELDDDGRARLYFATDAKAALVYGFSLDADSQVASWFARKH